MRQPWGVIWDLDGDPAGNVEHIALHGLTKQEVEDVLLDPLIPEGTSQSSGRPCKIGRTSTGRRIIVVWEDVTADPRVVYPVTAYEIN
jgi:hypothetical protein